MFYLCHCSYRSDIANNRSVRADLPPAADMRKLSWSSELASLAEMWAAQCSSEHETVRRVLINGVEHDVSSSSVSLATVFSPLSCSTHRT